MGWQPAYPLTGSNRRVLKGTGHTQMGVLLPNAEGEVTDSPRSTLAVGEQHIQTHEGLCQPLPYSAHCVKANELTSPL